MYNSAGFFVFTVYYVEIKNNFCYTKIKHRKSKEKENEENCKK